MIGFQNTEAFLCGTWNLCKEKLCPLGSFDLAVLHSSISIDVWSMAEMLWQDIHEIFIYF